MRPRLRLRKTRSVHVAIATIMLAVPASAFALSMFVIHLLGDVPSPWLIGRLSDLTSLGQAVLIVPIAVVVSGVVWLISARVCAKAYASAAPRPATP